MKNKKPESLETLLKVLNVQLTFLSKQIADTNLAIRNCETQIQQLTQFKDAYLHKEDPQLDKSQRIREDYYVISVQQAIEDQQRQKTAIENNIQQLLIKYKALENKIEKITEMINSRKRQIKTALTKKQERAILDQFNATHTDSLFD